MRGHRRRNGQHQQVHDHDCMDPAEVEAMLLPIYDRIDALEAAMTAQVDEQNARMDRLDSIVTRMGDLGAALVAIVGGG